MCGVFCACGVGDEAGWEFQGVKTWLMFVITSGVKKGNSIDGVGICIGTKWVGRFQPPLKVFAKLARKFGATGWSILLIKI